MRIRVIGAGVAGLTSALEFARAGCELELVESREGPGLGCSCFAGGMLAPWCEAENAERLIFDLGCKSLKFWTETVPVAVKRGTLVVAGARDKQELALFARRASGFKRIDAKQITALEPDLAGRFDEALFFPEEAHLDPRAAMATLAAELRGYPNISLRYGEDGLQQGRASWTIDCRGVAARDSLADLRGVRGEMLILGSKEIALQRPLRLLHPRSPVYIVPRGQGQYMVGATMIENEDARRITVRSLLELLGAAYSLHPAFAEAEVVETGAGVRPAFPDNLPRIRREGRTLYVNGFYRHGFLVAPALARRTRQAVLEGAFFPEVMDAHPGQRRIP